MTAALLAALLLLSGALVFLLIRATRRLLEFDELWQQILPVLLGYADDLRKMLSLDLLTDNPEVVAFHKRNLRMLSEIDEIAKSVRSVAPQRIVGNLPRPDVG